MKKTIAQQILKLIGESRGDKPTFVFTGSLSIPRSKAIQMVKDYGGVVLSSVTRDTDYLVTNDPYSGSAKNKKASELGVKILPEEDFWNMMRGGVSPEEVDPLESKARKSLGKIYNIFDNYSDILSYKWNVVSGNAQTYIGKDKMRRNGRAWTLGYDVGFENKETGNKGNLKFDIVTNEGGGNYGYVFNSAFYPTFAGFKQALEKYLEGLK